MKIMCQQPYDEGTRQRRCKQQCAGFFRKEKSAVKDNRDQKKGGYHARCDPRSFCRVERVFQCEKPVFYIFGLDFYISYLV